MEMLMPGRHINGWAPAAKDSVRRSPGGSLLLIGSDAVDREMCAEFRQMVPDGDILFRADIPNWDYHKVHEHVDELCRQVAPIQDLVTGVLVPNNEVLQEKWAKRELELYDIAKLTDYTISAAKLLYARGFTNVIGGSFSTTKPSIEAWELFQEALSDLDGVAMHEYVRPERQPEGHTFYWDDAIGHLSALYLATPLALRRPFYVTESGIDDNNGGGWQKYLGPVEYAQNILRPIGRKYAELQCVKTWMVYQAGAKDETWATFEIAGVPEIDAFMREGERRQVIMSEETPAYVTSENPEEWPVGLGVRTAMLELGDRPKGTETWVGHLGSYTEGEKNWYHWNKKQARLYVSYPFV